MTTTMKAVRLLAHGGPEALTYGDFPLPEIGPQDVRAFLEQWKPRG